MARTKTKHQTKIFPSLWYAKDAEGAARFYTSLFPDSRIDRIRTLHSDSPSGPPGSVRIVDFTLFGRRFQAMTAGPHHDFNDAISMVVLCDDQAELDRYWNAFLKNGGTPEACGWLIDRYGVRWQIVPARLEELLNAPDPARAKRVTDALLNMIKLDLAALERAARNEDRDRHPALSPTGRKGPMHADTAKYNQALAPEDRAITDRLAVAIDNVLPEAENKIWHGHPVWFLEGNPVVGYSKLKGSVRLLFWSGQSFEEEGLANEGKFKAAEARFTAADQVDKKTLKRWLAKARDIQWDYKNIVRRKGQLVRLK